MMALTLDQEQYVPCLFADLNQELSDIERLRLFDLFKYFTDCWMRNVSMSKVCDKSDKTNNYSEGYNNRFKNRLQKTHLNI